MLGKYFYNEGLRKVTIAFGAIFNNIQVQRTNSNGDVIQSIKVPLAYSPKEKFINRLDQQPNLDEREFAITLPRMGFEIKTLAYDPSRKLTRLQKFKSVKSNINGKVLDFNYTPVPYNIGYDLSIFTATAEGGLQITEQILPFFQPDYTVTVNVVPELNMKRDVPIILGNIDFQDSYDGSFTTRRAVVYTLSFTAKTYLYGPATTQKVVKTVQSDIYTDVDRVNKSREERIVIVPNPTTADANDDFGFTTTISNFQDGKVYSTTRDEDV
tara:strand:- start:190 stop:996 length:807 start_codon:yes stop_codon:yes gene_type:complete